LGGTYSLARIDGDPLPAVIDDFRDIHGNRYQLWLLSGTMKFRSGVFQKKMTARRVINGVPGDSILQGGYSGVYRWRDARTIRLQFVGDFGIRDSIIYQVLENGRVVRGIAYYYLEEWVRE
jgi:hypothetical protein